MAAQHGLDSFYLETAKDYLSCHPEKKDPSPERLVHHWKEQIGILQNLEGLKHLISTPLWAKIRIDESEKTFIKLKMMARTVREAPGSPAPKDGPMALRRSSETLGRSAASQVRERYRTFASVPAVPGATSISSSPFAVAVPLGMRERSGTGVGPAIRPMVFSPTGIRPSSPSAALGSPIGSSRLRNNRIESPVRETRSESTLLPPISPVSSGGMLARRPPPISTPSPASASPAPASPPPTRLGPSLFTAMDRAFELIKTRKQTECRFNGRRLEREHVRHLTTLVLQHPSVNFLDLRYSGLGDAEGVVLAKLIKLHAPLTGIDLAGNNFSPTTFEQIADAVGRNLNLGSCVVATASDSDPQLREAQRRLDLLCEQNRLCQKARTGGHTEVRLSGRQLQQVDWVFSLVHLTALDISGNGLVALPTAVEALVQLERLVLSRNQLDVLPAEICSMPRLSELYVAENQLEVLPSQIGSCPALTLLDIRSNLLREIPKALGSLKTLKTLRCSDNRWRKEMVIPKHVLAKGDDAILQYLRNLASTGEAHISRMKLMVVGNANVGKTSLLKGLRGVPRDKIRGNLATDGIQINSWAPDEKITFYCWDFAGQEVYYATHQFFLTPNSLYLLVFNLLEDLDTGKLAYWLENIYVRAGRAPVILVGTHQDEASKEVQAKQIAAAEKLASAHRQVALVTAVSCVTGKGVRELGKELLRIAAKQKWMQRVVPRSYTRLAERLAALKDGPHVRAYVDWGTYRRAAAECGIAEDELPSATDYLVNLGEIAFSPERKSTASPTRDRELVVLDSMWLTKAFASLISLKTSFIRDGTLPASALPHVWAAYPPDVIPFLLSLFERYELLYQAPDGQLVVPLLLREARPSVQQFDSARTGSDPTTEVARVYNFDFLPVGFFARWMVKVITLGFKPSLVWRSGLVGSDGSCWVHTETDLREGSLRLGIRGATASDVLLRLHNELTAFMREWAKLQPKAQFIICPHCPNHRLPLAQFVALPPATVSILCPATNLPIKISAVFPERALTGADTASEGSSGSGLRSPRVAGVPSSDDNSSSSDADARDEHTIALLDNLVTEMNRARMACKRAEQACKPAVRQRVEAASALTDAAAELPRVLEQCSQAAGRLQTKAQQLAKEDGLDKRLAEVTEQHLRLLEALRSQVSVLEDTVRELVPTAPLLLKAASDTADLESSTPAIAAVSKTIPGAPADYSRTVNQLKSLQAIIQAIESCVWVQNVARVQQRALAAKAARCAELRAALADLQKQLDTATDELAAAAVEAESSSAVLSQLQDVGARLQPLVANGHHLDMEKALTAEASSLLSEYRTMAKTGGPLADPDKHDELSGLRAAPSEDKDTPELKLVKRDGEHAQVRAGTMNALIERLTYERYPDPAFQRAFLLTYRSFISATDLLEKLMFRYCVTPLPSVTAERARAIRSERQLPIRLRVMGVLKYWVENHCGDFLKDATLRGILNDFLRDIVSATGHRKFAVQLKTTLDKKVDRQSHGPLRRARTQGPPPDPIMPDLLRQSGGASRLTAADVDPVELARQLTLLSAEHLCAIQPSEFLGGAWQSKQKATLAPNILAMIQNFNRTSFFVVNDVLRTPDPAARRIVLKRWILCAKEAHRLNNFDALMGIIAALEKTAVRRLKKTWEGLDADVLEVFQQLVDFSSINYQKLKDQFRAAPAPRVPYIGVYLTDLMYTEEQPSMVEGTLINFAKLRKVATIIQDIQSSQDHNYNLRVVPEIQAIFSNWKMPWKDDDTLDEQIFNMSLRLEPRDNAPPPPVDNARPTN